MKKDKVIFTIGVLCFIFWVLDFINIVFLIKRPIYLLWYSSAGLLLTSVALMWQNSKFIVSMFCALFVMESIWATDFLANIFFKKNLLGITDYLFTPEYSKKDFIMTMYHVFLPPVLFVGLVRTKKVFQNGWIGATLYS